MTMEKMTAVDKRRHRRSDTIRAVQYVTTHVRKDEIFDGVVSNLSESGLCLLTTNPLSEGQNITIRNRIQANFQTATVRWITKYRGLYYMAGLEFM
jgi:hypothetical protein